MTEGSTLRKESCRYRHIFLKHDFVYDHYSPEFKKYAQERTIWEKQQKKFGI